MVMRLEKVVPFGRCLDEYAKMFNLTESDFCLNILGVGDGPASFNAELSGLGGRVTSIDPIYVFNASEIRSKFYEVLDGIIAQIKATPTDWVWSYHSSPENLRENRIRTTEIFSGDFAKSKESGRYVVGELPSLPFEDEAFDLALCSHFLFLYSAHFNYDFHLRSVKEMLRVAREIRIFPLLTLMLEKSPHLIRLIDELSIEGYHVEIHPAGYELQQGGNEVMVIKKPAI